MTVSTSLSDVGTRLLKRMVNALGSRNVDLYFESARLEQREGRLCLLVPNRFNKEWIEKRFADRLRAAARAELGESVEMDILVEPILNPQAPPMPARPTPRTDTPKSRRLRYALDDFVVGQSNRLAYGCALELMEPDGRPMTPLVIHGGCGLGKTHLLQGICGRFASHRPGARWRYLTAEQFTNQFIHAVRHHRLPAFRLHMRELDLLVIDDMQFFSGKTGTQTELQHTIDTLAQRGGRLLVAGDGHPRMLDRMSEALVSRLLSGMIAPIEPPDEPMLRQLIEALARRRELKLRDTVTRCLAEQFGGSIRELEGILTRLKAMVLLDDSPTAPGQPIGHALLDRVMDCSAAGVATRPVRFDQIMRIVCGELGVQREQVLSRSKQRQVVLARSLVIHLARQMIGLSFPELSRQIGRDSHSTVITADQRVRRQAREQHPVRLLPDLTTTTMDRLVERLRAEVARSAQQAA